MTETATSMGGPATHGTGRAIPSRQLDPKRPIGGAQAGSDPASHVDRRVGVPLGWPSLDRRVNRSIESQSLEVRASGCERWSG